MVNLIIKAKAKCTLSKINFTVLLSWCYYIEHYAGSIFFTKTMGCLESL